MYTFLPSAKLVLGTSTGSIEVETPPIVIELSKKAHFCRFLEKEMSTAKTEAEKEAIQTILLETKIELRAMEKKWKKTQATLHRAGGSALRNLRDDCPVQRMQ
jgi:hypothetical protein